MQLVYCFFLTVSKNLSPVLNDILKSVIKLLNAFKCNDKCENIFKKLLADKNLDHMTVLFHAEVTYKKKQQNSSRCKGEED